MVDYFFINEKLLWSGLIRVWSDIFFNIGMTKWQKNFGFLQFLFSKSHQFLWGWSVIRVWSDIFFRIFSTMVVYTGTVLYSERESMQPVFPHSMPRQSAHYTHNQSNSMSAHLSGGGAFMQ